MNETHKMTSLHVFQGITMEHMYKGLIASVCGIVILKMANVALGVFVIVFGVFWMLSIKGAYFNFSKNKFKFILALLLMILLKKSTMIW